MKTLTVALLGAILLTVAGCQSPAPAPPETASSLPEGAPRLVLFLVIDQARADYLERFRPLLTGGLGRLLEESVVFTDAHHDHSYTATAPGHATLSTGRYPAHHGVVANYWYDRKLRQEVYSVMDDDDDKRTSERLLASSFGDWLKAAAPAAKVFAVSGKDRAAVLTAGHHADAAYWYDKDSGDFITADFYASPRRPWLEAFHDKHHCQRLFGEVWQPLPEVAQHGAEYDIVPFDQGLMQTGFPRPLGGAGLAPDEDFYKAIYGTPFADRYLGDFVRALIEGEGLGKDDTPNFLGIAFSTLDSVGHTFGPNSPEVMDTLLRLDRVLGELLDFIDRVIGLEHVVVSLSADHGVTPVPELLKKRGEVARRLGAEEISCMQQVDRKLREAFGDEDWVLSGFYFDRELIQTRGVDLNDLLGTARRHLETCPGIDRVWTPADLDAAPGDDPYARLYRHNLHPERSPDLFVQYTPHTLTSRSSAASHGTPHAYDTAVPWLLRLPEGRHVQVDERVYTVDVAPTVAALLGLSPMGEVDGVDRAVLFR